MRLILVGVVLAGCIAQASTSVQNAISPPASGGGTLTCRQIMEQCDAQCGDPLCVRRCGDHGTPDAARYHDALVECAQRNSCMDEPCIRTHCGAEADTCYAHEPPPAVPEGEPAPAEGEPSAGAPGAGG